MKQPKLINLKLVIKRKKTSTTVFVLDRVVASCATPRQLHALAVKFTDSGRTLFTAAGTYSGPDTLLVTVHIEDHVTGELLTHITTVM